MLFDSKMTLNKLDRDFYTQSTEKIAKNLLGKYLVHDSCDGKTAGKVVETEAYLGEDDPAAHTYQDTRTDRTEVMFGPPGYAYVYLIYGMYHCFNVVTGGKGDPEAVFIRALEPIDGIKLMQERREIEDISGAKRYKLTDGPGKLCMAMDIDKRFIGEDLLGDRLFITEPKDSQEFMIEEAERINIDYADEAAEWELRYYISDNPYVSEK